MAEDIIKSKIEECVACKIAYETASNETKNGRNVITELKKELKENESLSEKIENVYKSEKGTSARQFLDAEIVDYKAMGIVDPKEIDLLNRFRDERKKTYKTDEKENANELLETAFEDLSDGIKKGLEREETYDFEQRIMGQGSNLKSPYIKINNPDFIKTDNKGFYITVSFDYEKSNFSIVLCFGSKEDCKEYSQAFYNEALKIKREEIDNKTTDDKKINTDDPQNYVLCCYDYTFDEINSITDETFKEKLNNILDLYETGIKWINENNWFENFKSYTPNAPLEERLIKSLEKHKEVIPNQGIFLRSRQTILYGPPGTGKTRLAKAVARALLDVKSEDELENNEQFMFVQFHPGYSYSEFVETISMESKYAKTNNIKYGKFRSIVERANGDPDNPYVLIIDEINRANVSETFGELLYGLEYRGGVPIKTSISQTELVVPENLFIICTMNTADRSLQSLDYALRRRFVFVSVYSQAPEPKNKKEEGNCYYQIKNNKNKFFMNNLYKRVCGWIEQSVARGVDPQDIMPGISYFLINKIGEKYDEDHLDYKLNFELIPLLEDYMKNGMFSNRSKIVDGKSLTELLKERTLQEKLKEQIEGDS